MGEGGVGKSTIVIGYIFSVINFQERYDPTIEDSYRKQVEIDGEKLILEIMDTAGTEKFTAMWDFYIMDSDGFILVYSISNKSGFEDLPQRLDTIVMKRGCIEFPLVIVGNKVDLEEDREIAKEKGEELAKKWKCSFIETSARNNVNVSEIFLDVSRQIIKERQKEVKKKPEKGCLLF